MLLSSLKHDTYSTQVGPYLKQLGFIFITTQTLWPDDRQWGWKTMEIIDYGEWHTMGEKTMGYYRQWMGNDRQWRWKTIGNYRQWEMTGNGETNNWNYKQWEITVVITWLLWQWEWQTKGMTNTGIWQTIGNDRQCDRQLGMINNGIWHTIGKD